jgi:CheY-like chemotaxis protein
MTVLGETMPFDAAVSVVLIDDEVAVLRLLEQALRAKGLVPHAAQTGAKGLELVKQVRPAIVLTDVNMPGMTGIEVLRDVKRLDPEIVVLIMTGYSTEDLVLEAFHAGATNYLKKPFTLKTLAEVLDGVLDLIQSKAEARVPRSSLLSYRVEGTIDVPIDPRVVGRVVGGVINEIRPYLRAEDADSLHMCVYEIVMNGIEHGVLKIGYETKSLAQEEDRLNDLYLERMNDPDYDGWVHLGYEVTPERLAFVVADSGPGFDVGTLPDPTLDDSLFLSHGRGVMLTKMIADELTYNESGNRATIIKLQPAARPAALAAPDAPSLASPSTPA